MNRILLLLLCVCLWAGKASAESYKVLFVNDASLKYTNGKPVKVGDTFTESGQIKWMKEKQAVKAINLTTKKQVMFLGKKWLNEGGISALIDHKHLSTNSEETGLPPNLYEKLMNTFDSEYFLLDDIEVPTDVELSETHYFTATYNYGDTKLTKRLSHRGQNVIIDQNIFKVDGEKLEPRDITLAIEYIDGDNPNPVFVKDNIELTFIPDEID